MMRLVRRQTTLVLSVVAVAATCVFAGKPTYTGVDVLALSVISDRDARAYDGQRVRLQGPFVDRVGTGGPPYDLSAGLSQYDRDGHRRDVARVLVVPVAGDAPPTDGGEAVYWGTLSVGRHGSGPPTFTLGADRPGGFWSGPPLELFRLGWLLATLPYVGLAAVALYGVRRMWHLHLLRQLRPGCCPACGYDLRGSPGRCPECGRGSATEPP